MIEKLSNSQISGISNKSRVPLSSKGTSRERTRLTPLQYKMRNKNSKFPLATRLANFNSEVSNRMSMSRVSTLKFDHQF